MFIEPLIQSEHIETTGDLAVYEALIQWAYGKDIFCLRWIEIIIKAKKKINKIGEIK